MKVMKVIKTRAGKMPIDTRLEALRENTFFPKQGYGKTIHFLNPWVPVKTIHNAFNGILRDESRMLEVIQAVENTIEVRKNVEMQHAARLSRQAENLANEANEKMQLIEA
jgi:hypothetical protein